ncbi:D-isomer specific 2-hydroxyacid dehydrogenase, NAD binding domain-containing protein [Cladophialophora immunda]|nr:D-isomer specific 2-hydroxyacid dehydrogenase, NAD binding domain-containing protein [Cladophialophora immunda]
MAANGTSTSTSTPLFSPGRLPPGKDKHHIVVLEGIHARMPSFDFPHTIDVYQRTPPAEVGERIKDATIVIACVVPVTPADMDRAPHLGVLAVMAVGISWVDKQDCARRGVTVTKCPAGNVDAVTEHFLGLYFAARKRVVQVHNTMTTTAEWLDKGTLTKLWPAGPPLGCRQETLGIMGYGTLGTRLHKLAHAVGFGDVLVSERKNAPAVRPGRVSFDEVLARATVVGVCLPKDHDTHALARALREGWIAGAATDVLETEPAGPGTSPLIPDLAKGEDEVPNLTISSHIAWFTQSTIQNYQRLLKEGIEGWVAGTLQEAADKVHKVVVVHNGRIWN